MGGKARVMKRLLRRLSFSLLALGLTVSPVLAEPSLTLEKIMSHPSWIGRWPEEVRFAPAGETIFALRKSQNRGQEVLELDRQGKAVTTHGTGSLPAQVSRGKGGALFVWRGDLFLETPKRHRLTHTSQKESDARWLDADTYTYQVGGKVMTRQRQSGAERQVAEFVYDDDPTSSESSFVQQQQERLFPILSERQQAIQKTEQASGIPKIYLGAKKDLVRAELSSDARQLLLVTTAKSQSKQDLMPDYVTGDGYVKTESTCRNSIAKAIFVEPG